MTLQPYEIANFNLIEFASIYNKFIDTNDPVEIETQWIDKDGNINTIKIENVASVKQTIKSDIEEEAKLRENADKELDQKILQTNIKLSKQLTEEIQNRVNGDKTLENIINSKVEEINTCFDKIKDALNEEISKINQVEEEFNKKISDEIVARETGDKHLDDKFSKLISDESTAREAADSELNNKIDNVNITLSDKLSKEIQDRINGDNQTLSDAKNYIDNSIKIEKEARIAADGDLQFNEDIKDENGNSPTNLTEAINDVDHKLENEIQVRVKEIKNLENNIENVNENLFNKLNIEVQNRSNADKEFEKEIKEISKKIEAILAGSSTDLDSFKELVDYINSIDAENDEALAKFIKDTLAKFNILFTGVGFDENGYVAPKQAHYINDVDSLYDADKELDAALYVVSNNIASEVNRAKTAEEKLQKAIEDEVNTRAAEDQKLQKAIIEEASRAQSVEGDLDDLSDDIRKEDGSKPENLVEAINIVNEKIYSGWIFRKHQSEIINKTKLINKINELFD